MNHGCGNNNRGGNRNGGGNQPQWNGAAAANTGWNRNNFPANVRNDDVAYYYLSHGHDVGHNSRGCNRKCTGHQANTTTHADTGGDPKYNERTVFPAQMALCAATS